MGRRRQKVVKTIKRKLPDLFLCPKCGKNNIKVTIDPKRETAFITCGACGLRENFHIPLSTEPVDAYNIFIDQFYSRP